MLYCPRCAWEFSKVLDTRAPISTEDLRRRRRCLDCGHTFTTAETRISSDGETADFGDAGDRDASSTVLRLAMTTSTGSTSLNVRIPSSMAKRIEAMARAESNPESAIVRRLLSLALTKEERDDAQLERLAPVARR